MHATSSASRAIGALDESFATPRLRGREVPWMVSPRIPTSDVRASTAATFTSRLAYVHGEARQLLLQQQQRENAWREHQARMRAAFKRGTALPLQPGRLPPSVATHEALLLRLAANEQEALKQRAARHASLSPRTLSPRTGLAAPPSPRRLSPISGIAGGSTISSAMPAAPVVDQRRQRFSRAETMYAQEHAQFLKSTTAEGTPHRRRAFRSSPSSSVPSSSVPSSSVPSSTYQQRTSSVPVPPVHAQCMRTVCVQQDSHASLHTPACSVLASPAARCSSAHFLSLPVRPSGSQTMPYTVGARRTPRLSPRRLTSSPTTSTPSTS